MTLTEQYFTVMFQPITPDFISTKAGLPSIHDRIDIRHMLAFRN